jgi:hypothetical protein
MAITQVLGTFTPIERFYCQTREADRKGYFGENMAISVDQEACIERLDWNMRKLTEEIRERNKDKFIAYDVLSPHNIPLTTEI